MKYRFRRTSSVKSYKAQVLPFANEILYENYNISDRWLQEWNIEMMFLEVIYDMGFKNDLLEK